MLTKRKSTILRAIVGEYIDTAIPVASEGVVRKHGLNVSSATVRNEMGDLEENGYITRPHTSSGRVPLDKGYRFYVESLEDSTNLPIYITDRDRRSFDRAGTNTESWFKTAASTLARMSGNMALVTVPKAPKSRVKHVELVQVQDSLVLMILVLQEAKLRQQLINIDDTFNSEDLVLTSIKLRSLFVGLNAVEVEEKSIGLSGLEQDLSNNITSIMHDEDRVDYSDHFVDGLSFLLSQPEFTDSEKLREIVSCLEDHTLIQTLLENAPRGHTIKIQIGSENSEDVLRDSSVILCRYGILGQTAGLMAVIGPTRMSYSSVLSGVKYVSSVLDEMLEGLLVR